jgi:hypothetical protein
MHERQSQARAELNQDKRCPRCNDALVEAHDQVRMTKFSYFRCAEHGRFISFFQWLKEKSLVRAPNPKELEALKAQVKFVNCSNCGAPVSLAKETACSHCNSPLSVLAPENLEKMVSQLAAKEIDRTTFKPEKVAEAMMVKHQLEAQYRNQEIADAFTYGRGRSFKGDLVGLGIGLLLDLVF